MCVCVISFSPFLFSFLFFTVKCIIEFQPKCWTIIRLSQSTKEKIFRNLQSASIIFTFMSTNRNFISIFVFSDSQQGLALCSLEYRALLHTEVCCTGNYSLSSKLKFKGSASLKFQSSRTDES